MNEAHNTTANNAALDASENVTTTLTRENMLLISEETFEASCALEQAFRITDDFRSRFVDTIRAPEELLRGGKTAQSFYNRMQALIFCIWDYIYKAKVELELVSGNLSEQTKAYLTDAHRIVDLHALSDSMSH
ncbi:MAG: hypothetical protein IJ457_07135 [Clostridia bacterium]|nr:hypothetical protein [Clostridia bacterium]